MGRLCKGFLFVDGPLREPLLNVLARELTRGNSQK
jgi:hypothetical protein